MLKILNNIVLFFLLKSLFEASNVKKNAKNDPAKVALILCTQNLHG